MDVINTGKTILREEEFWNPRKRSFDIRYNEAAIFRHQLIGDNTLGHSQRPNTRSILKEHMHHGTLDMQLNKDTQYTSATTASTAKPSATSSFKDATTISIPFTQNIHIYIAKILAFLPHIDHHHIAGAIRLRFPDEGKTITPNDVWNIRQWLEIEDTNLNRPQARLLGLARHVGEIDQFKLVRADRMQIQNDMMEATTLGLDESDGPSASGGGIVGGLVW